MNHKSLNRFRPVPVPLRLISWLLIIVQSCLPFTNQLFAAVDAKVQTAPATRMAAVSPAAPSHAINHSVPVVERPTSAPVFSENPTAQEIVRARVFSEPLLPL